MLCPYVHVFVYKFACARVRVFELCTCARMRIYMRADLEVAGIDGIGEMACFF